jgi:hypothetical protein
MEMRVVSADNFLPTSAAGRVVAGLLSAALLVPAAAGLYGLTLLPAARTATQWVVLAACGEFLGGLAVVSGCGLVWAVAAPGWLPPLAWRYGRRLSLVVSASYLFFCGWALWHLVLS